MFMHADSLLLLYKTVIICLILCTIIMISSVIQSLFNNFLPYNNITGWAHRQGRRRRRRRREEEVEEEVLGFRDDKALRILFTLKITESHRILSTVRGWITGFDELSAVKTLPKYLLLNKLACSSGLCVCVSAVLLVQAFIGYMQLTTLTWLIIYF